MRRHFVAPSRQPLGEPQRLFDAFLGRRRHRKLDALGYVLDDRFLHAPKRYHLVPGAAQGLGQRVPHLVFLISLVHDHDLSAGFEARMRSSLVAAGTTSADTRLRQLLPPALGPLTGTCGAQILFGVLGLKEDPVGHDGRDRRIRALDLELGSQLAVLDGHHRVADVLLQARRMAGRGDLADPLAVLVDREVVDHRAVVVRPEVATPDLDADQLAADALFADLLQRLFADKVLLLGQLHHPLVAVADLVGVGVVPHVAAQGQDAALNAPDVARPDRRYPVRLAGLKHTVPELEAVAAGVFQVELVAELPGIAGAGDDQLHPVELPVDHVVVGDLQDALAEQVGHDLLRLRPLNLHRAHVRLPDLHVHPRVVGEALGPEQHVAVGQGKPEMVFLEAQQHRVVDDAALSIRDEGILALFDVALVEVARGEHVRELEGVGAGDLDLPLGPADVPHRDSVEELPVLFDRVPVVARVVVVVVDAVLLDPVLTGAVEVWGPEQSRVQQDTWVVVYRHCGYLLSWFSAIINPWTACARFTYLGHIYFVASLLPPVCGSGRLCTSRPRRRRG